MFGYSLHVKGHQKAIFFCFYYYLATSLPVIMKFGTQMSFHIPNIMPMTIYDLIIIILL